MNGYNTVCEKLTFVVQSLMIVANLLLTKVKMLGY